MTSNPPQVAAIHIHFSRPFSQAFRIAMMFWVGRVLPLTVHRPIPLRTRIRFTSFVLTCRCLAIWTFLHNTILAHFFGHSPFFGESHSTPNFLRECLKTQPRRRKDSRSQSFFLFESPWLGVFVVRKTVFSDTF